MEIFFFPQRFFLERGFCSREQYERFAVPADLLILRILRFSKIAELVICRKYPLMSSYSTALTAVVRPVVRASSSKNLSLSYLRVDHSSELAISVDLIAFQQFAGWNLAQIKIDQKIDGSSSRQDREGARGRLGAARKRESSFSPTIA